MSECTKTGQYKLRWCTRCAVNVTDAVAFDGDAQTLMAAMLDLVPPAHGTCNCPGCAACNDVVACKNSRMIFHHHPGGPGHELQTQERQDAIDASGWDTEHCKCDGACGKVNEFLLRPGNGPRRIGCAPTSLCIIKTLQTGRVGFKHLCCRCTAICAACDRNSEYGLALWRQHLPNPFHAKRIRLLEDRATVLKRGSLAS